MIPEVGIHAVLLHIQTGKGIIRTSADLLHSFQGASDLAIIPIIVHKELVDAVKAIAIGFHPQLVVGIDRIAIADTTVGHHGVIPAENDVRPLRTHIEHHFFQQPCRLGRTAVGFLVVEIAIETIVIHHFQQLICHREGSICRLPAESRHLLRITTAIAIGETQGCQHRHTIGMSRIDKLTGGAYHQALFRTSPVHKRIGILPVIKGPAQEILAALSAGIVMIRVCQSAKHQLRLRICLRIDHKATHPVSQRNTGPVIACVGICFRCPLQQRIDVKGRTNGHQRFPRLVRFVGSCRTILAHRFAKSRRCQGQYHRRSHQRCANSGEFTLLHTRFLPDLHSATMQSRILESV